MGNCLCNFFYLKLISQIMADQVVMSHSPLKMFNQFHDKHILVSGQGPVLDIAKGLGFSKMTTIDTIRQCFPHLDMVDHNRRKPAVSEVLSCCACYIFNLLSSEVFKIPNLDLILLLNG